MYVFLEFCAQAKVYAVLALFILLYSVIKTPEISNYDITMLIIKAVIMICVTFGINKLCTKGFKYVAWLVAIIPHVIILLFMVNTAGGKKNA